MEFRELAFAFPPWFGPLGWVVAIVTIGGFVIWVLVSTYREDKVRKAEEVSDSTCPECGALEQVDAVGVVFHGKEPTVIGKDSKPGWKIDYSLRYFCNRCQKEFRTPKVRISEDFDEIYFRVHESDVL